MEMNPYSTNSFLPYFKAGVNRFSIGVQSLNDADLLFLGREHSADDAIKTIQNALEATPNINLDLMYGLPNQSLADWEKVLLKAISLNTPSYKRVSAHY